LESLPLLLSIAVQELLEKLRNQMVGNNQDVDGENQEDDKHDDIADFIALFHLRHEVGQKDKAVVAEKYHHFVEQLYPVARLVFQGLVFQVKGYQVQ
jgi:hypothetical protein